MSLFARRLRILVCTAVLAAIYMLCPIIAAAQASAEIKFAKDTAYIEKILTLARNAHDPDSSIIYYHEAFILSNKVDYPDGASSALLGIGLRRIELGNFEEALETFKKAYPFCKKAKHFKAAVALYFNNSGLAYFNQGDYVNASAFYHEALKELRKLDKTQQGLAALIYGNLATIQIRLKQYGQALVYLNEGEKIAREGGFLKRLALILSNKGVYYSDLNQFDSARRYLNESLSIFKQLNNPNGLAACNINLGDILVKEKQDAKALPFYLEALKISNKAAVAYTKVSASYSLGEAYFHLKRYSEAATVLDSAITFAKGLTLLDDLPSAYGFLAAVYKASGQYAKASAVQDSLLILKDSLFSTEKTKAINILEVKYRTAEKDKQLAIRNLQLAKQQRDIERKNSIIVIASVTTLLVTALLFALYRSDKHKQKLQAEKINILEKEQEISQLKGMMKGEEKERARVARELHDGIVGLISGIRMNFNTVQKRHGLSEAEDFKEALAQLANASDEVRKTAYNLMPETLLQGGLAEAINHYCRKMSQEGLDIGVQFYGNIPSLDPDFELSVYRIVQELVQNVNKHAEANEAIVQLSWLNDQLSITVEDDGKGMTSTEHKGMGLQNVAARVKAFNGHMQIQSDAERGTTVVVEFEAGMLVARAADEPVGDGAVRNI